MNNLDSLERRLPDLMAELSPPSVPDYFDDMLRATARTRQRPAWASLERWLPMELTARPAPFGLPSWRPVLAVVVLVALLVATGAMLIAGSKRPLPPLFGPARNGAVIYGTTSGDILSLDPVTGKAVTIIGGAADDHYPNVSPDGQRLQFVRLDDPVTLYTANIDGTGIRAVASAKDANWSEWSPNGQHLAYIAEGGGTPFILDVSAGTTRSLPVSSPVHAAEWLSDDELLLIADVDDVARTLWTIHADGSDQHLLTLPDACCGASVLQGRGKVAWTSSRSSTGSNGRVHILDLGTGVDRELESTNRPGLLFLDPSFSPDGTWLLVKQFGGTATGLQPALLAADGSGEFLKIGREILSNDDAEFRATFSPDGTQLLMTYDDGSAWLYAVPSGVGHEVEWSGLVEASWQRAALSTQ